MTKPTLQDVANQAGVSSATISRALNEPDKVAKSTRLKIDAAIAELGYTPNFGARVLASNRTTTIGAVIPTLANAIFATGVQAFQEAMAEAGMTLLIATTNYDPETEFQQIKQLVTNGAGGLLLIGSERPEQTRDFLRKRNIPYVLGWCSKSAAQETCVGFDNAAAAYDATRRVLAQGHRRIAVLSGVLEGNDRSKARLSGIRRAVAEHGRGAAVLGVAESQYLLQRGADAFSTVYSRLPHPTAVICGNDVLAAGAMIRAREMGLSVPGDVSIIGFDDIGLARAVYPALTTVRVPQIEMGQRAAKVLLAALRGDPLDPVPPLKTEFILRGTLAPPPSDVTLRDRS